MTGTGIFPKIDGDIFYGQDANLCYFGVYGNNVNYGNKTVTGVAIQILASNTNRVTMLIYNNSATDIYIGTSGVTTSNGYKILSGDTYVYNDNDAIYAIASGGSNDLRYFEVTN